MRVEVYDNGRDYEVRWYTNDNRYSIEGIYKDLQKAEENAEKVRLELANIFAIYNLNNVI